MKAKRVVDPIPSVGELKRELKRSRLRQGLRAFRHMILYLAVAAVAAIVLAGFFWLPARKMNDNSMTPTLPVNCLSLTLPGADIQRGDVIAFQGMDRIQIRRMIANAGDWVDIDAQGNVYVNNELLDEPYVEEKVKDPCEITFPYQVPADTVFVLGDHRAAATDSRSSEMGCIAKDQIRGKLLFTVWPLWQAGWVK